MKIYNQLAQFLSFASITFVLMCSSVFAHESRIVINDAGDQLRITVGNQPEPVFAGQMSRTDLILNEMDSEGNAIPVDVENGGASIENLTAYVIFLKEEMHVDSLDDPLVLKSMEIHDIEQVSETNNRYQSPIIYTHPGAYGFHYVGNIITGDGKVFNVDEFFVCGGGSLADPREDGSVPAFGCVVEPVSFPGDLKQSNGNGHKYAKHKHKMRK